MARTISKASTEAAPIGGGSPELKTYLIEKTAPPWIAGRLVGDATEIDLTDDQALMELLSGHIWPKGVERQPMAATDTSKVD